MLINAGISHARVKEDTMAAPHNAPTGDQLTLAAVLIGEGAMPDREVARLLNISPRTLVRWKQRPDMTLALDAIRLLSVRAIHRDHGGRYWRPDLGPQTANSWQERWS
jgi:hypothetical protein